MYKKREIARRYLHFKLFLKDLCSIELSREWEASVGSQGSKNELFYLTFIPIGNA